MLIFICRPALINNLAIGKSPLSPSALQQALAGSGRHVRIDEAAMNGGAGNKANPIYVVVEEGKGSS